MSTPRIRKVLIELAGQRIGASGPPPMVEKLGPYLAALTDPVYPDECEVLEEVCKLIDQESDAHTAWQKLDNLDETFRLLKPVDADPRELSIKFNLGAATIAYFDLKKQEIASGVLVEISGRCFVATTSHSVPLDPQSRIVVLTASESDWLVSTPTNTPEILSFGFSDHGDVKDVAFMEFVPQFVSECFKWREPIPLSRINPCGVGLLDHATYVMGYPAEMVQQQRLSRNKSLLQYTPQCWGITKVLMPEHWGRVHASPRRHSADIDLFVCYDRQMSIRKDGAETTEKLSKPFGLSGGGVWQKKNPTGEKELWTADDYNLIGIQSEWPGEGRYLRATQIEHWLRLLWNEKQELRGVLSDAFPAVMFADSELLS